MPEGADAAVDADFAVLLEVRDAVTRSMEDARDQGVIKKSQEADIAIMAPAQVADVLARYPEDMLAELLIVASVSISEGEELSVNTTHTDMPKCERCWNHRELSGEAGYEDICTRCARVVEAL